MTRQDIAHWIQQQEDELEYCPDGVEEPYNGSWSLTFAPRPIITQTFHLHQDGTVIRNPAGVCRVWTDIT